MKDKVIIPDKGTLYFIGIGGIGMSALARVFHHYGYTIKGSDCYDSTILQELRDEGIDVTVGHGNTPTNIDVVVYSSAIDANNEEYKWFKKQNVPFIHRGMLLAQLMNGKSSIAVTGTHGKTTTSSLIAFLARECSLEPTALVGGYINNYDSNVLLGKKEFIVAEVDESDKSQLFYSPKINIITNLEADHLDSYKDMGDICEAFEKYLNNLSDDSVVIYCGDDRELTALVKNKSVRLISYGLNDRCQFQAKDIVIEGNLTTFQLFKNGRFISEIVVPLLGEHNVVNSLAAFATLDYLGIHVLIVAEKIRKFKGVKRRMETLYDNRELTIIDDYAHHPTEIQAVLSTLRRKRRRIIAIFQPHRYTRTLHLLDEFKDAFHSADMLILTNIYSACEETIDGISIQSLSEVIKTVYFKPCFVVSLDEIARFLETKIAKHDIVAFLGAGDITNVAQLFAEKIKRRNAAVEMVR